MQERCAILLEISYHRVLSIDDLLDCGRRIMPSFERCTITRLTQDVPLIEWLNEKPYKLSNYYHIEIESVRLTT